METVTPVVVLWSGGKDSCTALYEILGTPDLRVVALVTTVTGDYDRISIHGVRRSLLEQQAAALDLPLHQVSIRKNASNEEYEREMAAALVPFRDYGAETVVSGDLFLEDIRHYREEFLTRLGMRGLFPVWGRDTTRFINSFIELGFKAVVTCVDLRRLDESFAGREIDADFLRALPRDVDPCGENGEFHTFVFDGPIFKSKVRFETGERVRRDNHYLYCDLVPT